MESLRTLTMIIRQPAHASASVGRASIIFYAFFVVLSFVPGSVASAGKGAAQTDGIWVEVDTSALRLYVMQDSSVLYTYENIAIGSNGATSEKRLMDEKTPLGEFRIDRIKKSERFVLFLSIDYPTMDHAQRAVNAGDISSQEYQAVRKAWRNGEPPPQTTSLGGHLGIHGIGRGSLDIHNTFNWTNGCVALTNEQVLQLAELVSIGTRVLIR